MHEKLIKKIKPDLLLFIFINALILVFYLVVFMPVYEVNDDSALCNLVNGSMGKPDPHVVFQNYVLGLLYTFLYRITASVAWYAIIQYFFIFISLTVLGFSLMDYFEHQEYLGVIVAILAAFGYDLYVRPQFSKTAAVLVVSGLTLLFCTLVKEKILKRRLLGGCFLVLIGAMYRMSVFKCLLLIFTAVVFYYLLTMKSYAGMSAKRRLAAALATGLVMLAVVFGFDHYDQIQYRSDSWAYYRDFNAQRVKLSDYGFPEYKNHEKEYNEIGFDLSAIKLLRRWTFQDAERYTARSLQDIVELKEKVTPPQKIDSTFCKDFVRKLLKGLIKLNVFWYFLISGLICLLWGRIHIKKVISLFYEMIVLLFVYGYTFYKGRFMMHRIDVGIWLAALIVMLLIYKPEKTVHIKKAGICLVVAALLLSVTQHPGAMRLNNHKKVKAKKSNRKIIEKIHEDRDHLYLKTIGSVSFYKAYGVFDPTPVGIGDNQYSLGGWMAQTETCRNVLDRYDVRNPLYLRDIIDNDQVLLIDKNIDIMVEYLRHWYDENARAEKVDRIGKWNVYKIVTDK